MSIILPYRSTSLDVLSISVYIAMMTAFGSIESVQSWTCKDMAGVTCAPWIQMKTPAIVVQEGSRTAISCQFALVDLQSACARNTSLDEWHMQWLFFQHQARGVAATIEVVSNNQPAFKPGTDFVGSGRDDRLIRVTLIFRKATYAESDGRYFLRFRPRHTGSGLPVFLSSPATLTVLRRPGTAEITVQGPVDTPWLPGSNVTLTCSAPSSASPPASVKWTKFGDESFSLESATLRIQSATSEHSGIYICTLINSAGEGRSTGAALTFQSETAEIPPTSTPPPTIVSVATEITMTCSTIANIQQTSHVPARFLWTKLEDADFRHDQPSLVIQNTKPTDSGTYSCTGHWQNGVSHTVNMTITVVPWTINSRPIGSVKLAQLVDGFLMIEIDHQS